MAEPFKELVGPGSVATLAEAVQRAWPPFDAAGFQAAALSGLGALELKARVRHVAAALRARLPSAWPEAAAVLVAAAPPPLPDYTGVSAMFGFWPALQVVEDFGAEDWRTSLPALAELTRRFSAEFAIRPLIARWPAEVMEVLLGWTADADPHVRRLVSEGTRSRLPWGARLRSLAPGDTIPLLDRLVDDPSAYVRRSVANHLGDLAKDEPALARATAARWLAERDDRREVVRHGLRALLKAGDIEAMALLGQASRPVRVEALALATAVVVVGDVVELTARLSVDEATEVRADVLWQWPGARGGWSSKVLRVGDRSLGPGEVWALRFRLSTRPVTTRPVRLGEHRLTLRVQGVDRAPLTFELRAAD